MFRNVFITTCLSIFVLGFILFHCQLPSPPPSPDDSNIEVFLKSADGKTTGIEINDTIGNQIQIRLIFSLTNYIDSAKIEILAGPTLEQEIPCRYKKERYDTVYVPYSFSTSGTRTIKVTGYIKNYNNIVSTVTIHVFDRSSTNQNHKPVLIVPETQTVGVGQTISFPATATDPDSGQHITIKILNKPDSATFIADTFQWTPFPEDTGTIKVIFIATDNGLPIMSDTDSVVITINSKPVNRAPSWNPRKVQRSALPGTLFSYDLKNKYFDPDNDSLTLMLISAPPIRDTLIGNVYSFTPLASDTGKQTIHIKATDPSGLSDTLTIELMVSTTITTIPDKDPPVIKFQSPSKDTLISADSIEVKVTCADDSGISSVKGFLDASAFDLKKAASATNLWTGKVKGLPAGSYSTIKIVAADSSAARNSDSLSIRIKYDADTTKPIITRVIPAGDSASTNSSSYTITLNSNDASGIASVKATLGSQSFNGSKGQGDSWTVTIIDLVPNSVNSIVVTVSDSSLRKNPKSHTFYIKYDPTMLDTIGPAIIQKSGPVSNTIITNPLVTIVDSLFDPSGIDSAYWRLNNGPAKMMVRTGGKYSLTDSIKQEGFDTIVVTVTDSASRHNVSKQVIIINYLIPPVITVQPVSKTVCAGIPAEFSVSASGSAPLSYQWRSGAVNPVNINNARSATYSPQTSSSGQSILSCVVSNGSGIEAVSNLCTLTVNVSPTITGPNNQIICAGNNATLSVAAAGASGYQWYSGSAGSGTAISGATSSSYSTQNAGSYYCVVAGNGCSASSSVATVTVNSAPSITGPTNQTTCSGTNATLSVIAAGASGYQWYSGSAGSGTAISGATSSSYSTQNAGSYYCIVSGNGCSAISSVATVTVNSGPTVTGPVNQTICSGTNATLTVTAPGAIEYHWYRGAIGSGSAISGATSSTYSTQTAGSYYCTVTGNGCSSTSSAATVTVINPIAITGPSSPNAICSGGSLDLTVTPSSGTGLTWVWYKGTPGSGTAVSGTGYSGQSSANLTLGYPVTSVVGTTSYYCIITSNGCPNTSSTATVTVKAAPTITQQPYPVSSCSDVYNYWIRVDATGTDSNDSLSYQWYNESGPIHDNARQYAGTNTYMFMIWSITSYNNQPFYCIITSRNTGCSIKSDNYTINCP
jgi:hypothetical protein